jgi:hypothetical protein
MELIAILIAVVIPFVCVIGTREHVSTSHRRVQAERFHRSVRMEIAQ